MKKFVVFALLFLCSAPVFSNGTAMAADGYGTKVSITYPTVDAESLGLETSAPLVQPGSMNSINNPVWSPDGAALVFSDFNYICQAPVNGGQAEVKYCSAYINDSNTLSYDLINGIIGFGRDDTLLYFMKTRNNRMDLCTLDMNSGGVETLASGVGNARTGSDGKYLMYIDGNFSTVYVQDLTTGDTWQFASPSGFSGTFTSSADGNYFIYTAAESDTSGVGNNQFFRMPIKGGTSERLSTYPGENTGYNRCNPICLKNGEWILYDDLGNVTYSGEGTTSEGSYSYSTIIWKMCAFNMKTRETLDLLRCRQLSKPCTGRYPRMEQSYVIYITISPLQTSPNEAVFISLTCPRSRHPKRTRRFPSLTPRPRASL